MPAVKRLCDLSRNQTENRALQIQADDLLQQLYSKISVSSYNNESEENPRDLDGIMDECEGDDEDGPVVVPMDEITASMERTTSTTKEQNHFRRENNIDRVHASKYPFLFASMIDDEDILMTCARILDAKTDVTAVREAAAYLEEVESQK